MKRKHEILKRRLYLIQILLLGLLVAYQLYSCEKPTPPTLLSKISIHQEATGTSIPAQFTNLKPREDVWDDILNP